MPPLPPVTQFLMLLCTAIFCLQQLFPLTSWFALWPVNSARFMPWQVVTYAFAHGSFLQLFFDMFGLWMFGSELELLWGRRRYIQFLLAGVLAASAIFFLMELVLGMQFVLIGASSAVYALLLANGMLFPDRTIMLVIPPMPMKMKTFVIGFAVLTVLLAFMSNGVAEVAQLGGMLGGFLMIQYWRGRPPFGGGKRGGPRRLH